MRAKLIVGDSFRNADLFYATGGFKVPDPIIFVEIAGIRYVVVPELELGRARKEAKGCEVILQKDIIPDSNAPLSEVAIAALRKLGTTSCLVAETFPAKICRKIENAGIPVEFVEGWTLFPSRAIKRADEIEAVEQMQRTIEMAFEKIVVMLADSKIEGNRIILDGEVLTSELLRSTFEIECLKQGCVCPIGTVFASGDQAVDAHCDGRGPILPHQLIVCDMFPRSKTTGYWADMTRTVVKGKASPDARKLYETVLDAQTRAIKMIKPGIDGFDIDRWIRDFFESKGYKTTNEEGFVHGTGHALGLDIHEPPRITKKKDQILVEGSVVTIEPGLYYLGIGGVRIEDMILVTADGYRDLTRTPKKFLEIP